MAGKALALLSFPPLGPRRASPRIFPADGAAPVSVRRSMASVLLTTLLVLINAARADVSVPPLAEDPVLQGRAQARAERMCAVGQFSHDGYQEAFRGSPYRRTGENLAMGHRDPRAIHRQLMSSPGHRANILKRDFTALGVGMAPRCNLTVELFGGR